jgi:hypothetical protein
MHHAASTEEDHCVTRAPKPLQPGASNDQDETSKRQNRRDKFDKIIEGQGVRKRSNLVLCCLCGIESA